MDAETLLQGLFVVPREKRKKGRKEKKKNNKKKIQQNCSLSYVFLLSHKHRRYTNSNVPGKMQYNNTLLILKKEIQLPAFDK